MDRRIIVSYGNPFSYSFGLRTGLFAMVVSWLCLTTSAQTPPGQTPSTKLTAPQLFPEKTLAYLRVDNVKELRAALENSSFGKLAKDDQVRPILSEFYGSLINSTDAIRESVGLNIDELLSIPSGELAIALLPSDQTQGQAQTRNNNDRTEVRIEISRPSVAVMMDAGEEIAGVQVVLDRMQGAIGDRMVHTEVKFRSLTIHQYSNPDRANEQFAYFIDQGVFVACSTPVGLERLATKWTGGQVDWPALAENRRFTSILGRCVGTQGERPQLSFFVDPLAIIKQLSPRTATTSMAFAMLPALGLDDIQAVGGSVIIAPPDFDSIAHLHVLLGSPRRAILALVRPKTGSTIPEDWVPGSVGSYYTINWDVASTLQGVEQLYNEFRGPDAMKTEIYDRISQRLELDFKKDILDSIDGRFTYAQGFVRPVRVNSGSNVFALKLRNAEYFKKNVMPKLVSLIEQRRGIQTENFGRWQVQVFQPRQMPEGSVLRQPEMCLTIIDDYLIVADSRYMMNELVRSMNSAEDRLSQALDFQLISDRIKAQLQGKECSGVSYVRPEESLQLFYELARDPANRDRLRQISASNGVFKALLQALESQKLPEFSVIAKYLAPGGGFLVEEETGIHYMAFGLRRE